MKQNKGKIIILPFIVLMIIGIFPTVTGIFLNDLEDVTISSPQDNQHLIYDSGSANWTNEDFAGGNGGNPFDQDLNTTDAPTFVTLNTGLGDNELYQMDQHLRTTSAPSFVTINTGHGANELYSMNQDVETTDAPTFNDITLTSYPNLDKDSTDDGDGYSGDKGHPHNQDLNTSDSPTFVNLVVSKLNTGQGLYELYSMNQDVETTDAVTFSTVNTGQGNNDLYDMDQNVLTSSDVEFDHLLIEDNTGDSSIEITPTEGNDAELVFNDALGAPYWRWYLDDTDITNIILEYVDLGNLGLQSKYLGGIPTGNINWGFDITSSPNYGITLGTVATAHDRGYADQWIGVSDPIIKELFTIPTNKLLRLYDIIKIYGYYSKNHRWDDGELIILDTDYSKINIGFNAEELKQQLENEFGPKVVNSIIYDRDFQNHTVMGINSNAIQIALIEGLRIKVKNLEDEIAYIKDYLGIP